MLPISYTLIDPFSDEPSVVLYQHIWGNLARLLGLYFLATMLMLLLDNVIQIPDSLRLVTNLGIVLFPLVAWVGINWYHERSFPQFQQSFIPVLLISFLTAHSIGYALVYTILEAGQWVSQGDFLLRIVGSGFAIIFVQESLKYLIIYYIGRPLQFQTRHDAVAYSITSTIAYVTVITLRYILTSDPMTATVMLQHYHLLSLHISTSLIVAYGIAEVQFSQPNVLFLSGMFLLSALVGGVLFTLHHNLIRTRFAPGISQPSLILSPLFASGYTFVIVNIIANLLDSEN